MPGYANTWNAAGNALMRGGDILDRLNDEAYRRDDRANADDLRKYQAANVLELMIQRRLEANRRADDAERDRIAAFRKEGRTNADVRQGKAMASAHTDYTMSGGSGDGSRDPVTGSVNGARRAYDPADPATREPYMAELAQSEILNRADMGNGITSGEVRTVLADNGSLGTPAGQRVYSSFYRPENDQAVRDQRAKSQLAAIAAAAARQQRQIHAAAQRGVSSYDIDALTQMRAEAQAAMDALLAQAGDEYKIGMDRVMDQRVSVLTQNLKTLDRLLNQARGKKPLVPPNPAGLTPPGTGNK